MGKEKERGGMDVQLLTNRHGPLAGSGPLANGAEDDGPWGDFKIITQYRPLLSVAYLGAEELVVVERSLVDVLAGLPPAYWKPSAQAAQGLDVRFCRVVYQTATNR